jgi:hypothetical protein
MKMRWFFLLGMIAGLSGLANAQNNALDFDGSNDWVNCGTDTSLAIGGTTITLEAWVYANAWKTNVYEGGIIVKEENTSNLGFMLRAGANGKLNFAIGSGGWQELTTSSSVMSLNTWYHVAATYDGTYTRLYLNGNPIDSLKTSINIGQSKTTPLAIGNHSSTSYSRYWQGKIDEVRIWNITRSHAQIKANMNREFCEPQKGLVAYYKFNQGNAGKTNTAVKTATDFSGNSLKATLNNFALSGASSNWVAGQTLKKDLVSVKDSVVKCDRYTSASKKVYTKSGTYYDTIPTYMTCDSAIELKLTIKNSTKSYIKTQVCDSLISPSKYYVWKSSGTYVDYIRNSIGCDSMITFFLTVGTDTGSMQASNCYSYVLPSGKTVTKSGVYLDTLTSYLGCDSFCWADITIHQATQSKQSMATCKPVQNPTKTKWFTKAGVYYDTLVNYHGCDSIIETTVTWQTTYASINRKACYSYTGPSGRHTWTTSGTYLDTLLNKAKCDSVITVNLTILESSTGQVDLEGCRYVRSPYNTKVVYSKSGTYTDTLVNAAGCDSIVTLIVKVNNVNTTVTQNGLELTAQSSGTLQWLNCGLLYKPVAGETSALFAPTVDGNYAVDVIEGNCRDTSTCFTIKGVGVDAVLAYTVKVYPQPSEGVLYLESDRLLHQVTLRLYDAQGRLVQQASQENMSQRAWNLTAVSGVYTLEIEASEGRFRQPVWVK